MKRPSVEQVELTFKQFCIAQHISEAVDIKAYYDIVYDSMLIEIRRHVAGRSRSITVSMPDGWLEAVKERWLPKRLLKRFPVKYRDTEAEVFAAYPELHIDPLRGRKGPMVYHTSVHKDWQ